MLLLPAPTWDGTFREVARRRIGSGQKLSGAEELTFVGVVGGREILLVSRIRLNNPQEGFLTCSSHRISGDSHVGREGHWVDLRVETPVSDDELDFILLLARSTDTRHVRVSRRRHGGIRTQT